MSEADDIRFMTLALTLGRRGLGNAWPNPAVGAVVVKNGVVVGRGWTQPGGRPHAEVEALGRAGEAGRGATLYATLEGRPPFGQDSNPIGLLHRVASGQVEPPRHAGALTPLLTRMLSTDVGARPTMAEVADQLDRFATDPEAPLLADDEPTDDVGRAAPRDRIDVGPPISTLPSRRRRWVRP